MKVSELSIGMADRKIPCPNTVKNWVSGHNPWPNTAMFSVKFCVVAMFFLLLILHASWALEVPFSSRKTIEGSFDGAYSVYAADIDGDGDMDVLGAAYYAHKIVWWENIAGDGSAWNIHPIDVSFQGTKSIYSADMDGDGDMDVIGASSWDDQIAWWENTAGNGSVWTKHTVDGSFELAQRVFAADMDGDGDTDIIGASGNSGLAWWKNTDGNGFVWSTRQIIDSSIIGDIGIYATDVDGDRDTDVIVAASLIGEIAWFENNGNGSSWSKQTLENDFGNASSVYVADMDGDGDMDILGEGTKMGVNPVNEIAWWENIAGDGSSWSDRKNIGNNLNDTLSVYAADMDGDGDIDVLGGGETEIVWWENMAGDGSAWTKQTIDGNFRYAMSVYAADIDGDGDTDVISASYESYDIAWWQNEILIPSKTDNHIDIDGSFDGAAGVYSADVDGDGDMDVIGAASIAGEIAWWENTAEDGSVWTKRTVDSNFSGAKSVYVTDVDRDGDVDMIGAASNSGLNPWGQIVWWENTAGNGSIWSKQTIDSSFSGANCVYATDVDGDGDMDVLSTKVIFYSFGLSKINQGMIAWWENTSGDGSAWSDRQTIDGDFKGARNVYTADIDGDGDMDVLGAHRDPLDYLNRGTAWWENVANDGSVWNKRSTFFEATYVYAEDIDGDGDMDILGASTEPDILWWENTAGNGSVWSRKFIERNFTASSVYATDVDGDGDMDVIGADPNVGEIAWWENTVSESSVWKKHILDSNFDGATSVYAADIDGDGHTDVLGTAYGADKISWWITEPGQFNITTSSKSHESIKEGTEDDVLKIRFKHMGKTGDVNIELSQIELLMEESTGIPLTSAQADVIFDDISVYLDNDGNGDFSAVDKPVLIMKQFSLTNGKLILPFNHYDENVKVTFGTPKTFFIVPKLAANAYFQTPDQFQVTFLSASAKYRDYNIALYHSHKDSYVPVSTGIIQIGDATPPVIMGLIDSDIPVRIKTWEWMATDAQAGIQYRYAVDQNPVTGPGTIWMPSAGFAPGVSAIHNSGNGIYYIHVQAADPSGNESEIKTVYGVLDNTLPAAPTVSGPNLTNDATPQWTYTSNGDGGDGYGTSSFYRYKLDNPYLETDATTTYMNFFSPMANLDEGTHTLYVQEKDVAGNWSASGEWTVTIDTVPPGKPNLNEPAPNPTNIAAVQWNWTSGGGGTGNYRYKINDSNLSSGAFELSGNPVTGNPVLLPTTLSHGIHTLYIQENDDVGNWSATASATVEVDLVKPQPPVVSGSTPVNTLTPTWTIISGIGGSGNFRYRINNSDLEDSAQTFSAYKLEYPVLSEGSYILYIQERDEAGNWSATVSHTIKVDKTKPNPPSVFGDKDTNDKTPKWTWVSNGDGIGMFRCQLGSESGDWSAETAGRIFEPGSDLADASYTLYVQEKDEAGNWSDSGSFQTTVDTVPPTKPNVSAPNLTNDPRPIWSWKTGGGGNGTFKFELYDKESQLQKAGYLEDTEYRPVTNLTEGKYTLKVSERDEAGNWSESAAREIEIDLTPPGQPGLTLSGNSPTKNTNITWKWWTSGDGGQTPPLFRYKLDDSYLEAGATETPELFHTFTLSDGPHRLYVQERDAAGNWSLYNSASVTVDTEAPNPPFVWNSTPLTNDPRPQWQWSPLGGGNGTFEYVLKKGTQTVLSGTVKAVSFVPGSDLADGVYTLSVREQDIAGNVSAYESSTLEVDRTAGGPPVMSVTTPTRLNPPVWQWTGNGGTGRFRYKLDPQNPNDPQMDTGATETWATWFRPAAILPDGDHFLFVQEMDAAENWSPFSMGRIEVDTGKPCSCASSESFVLVAAGGIEVSYKFDEVYAAEPCLSGDSETETSGSGLIKVELYVKKPGDSAYSLTATDAEGGIDGIFNYTVPGNAPGVYEFYTLAYDRAGNTENLSSACVSRTVFSTEFAGYALVIVGSVSDEEGLESHTKTGARVFQHLKNRNFLVSDTGGNHWDNALDHVKFFSPYNAAPIAGQDDYSVNPNDGLPLSYKEAVEHALTKWAPARIKEIQGPLWLVMLDHGSEDTFYLNGFEQITPQKLNEWLENMESQLPAGYFDKPENFIAVVLGACYSGSFIDSLAAPGRIIISSAAADEVSYRGPRVPGLYRDGEFFVSGLFNELGKGSTLYTSYTRAVELTENHTDSGLSDKKFPYFDTARQHPYLDDDGDPGTGTYPGSHTLRSGGDGDFCKLTAMGYGEETVPLEIVSVGKEKTVLPPSEHSNLLWAKTNSDGDPKAIRVWVEIRKPDVILAETGTGEDTSRIVDMISGTLEWNAAAGRYETTYTGFELPGRHTLFFYAMGTDELISHPKRTYVYKSLENSPPDSFTLLSPANGEKVPLTFLADWTDAADPDGDALTYTVTVSRNADLSAPVTEKTGLIYSHAVLSGTDGITDKNTYHWKVTATDGNGGITESAVRSFTADSTVNPTDIIAEGSVFDAVTGLPIPGADILYGTAVLKCDANGGYAKVLPWQVNYTVTVSAAGYGTESFTVANISEGDPVHENFGLYSLSNPGPGNIDGENGVTLADAVLVLKILAGADTGNATILTEADADGDNVIGLAEAVFILQKVAELRE